MQKLLLFFAKLLAGGKGEELVRHAVEQLRLMAHSAVDYLAAALLAALLAYLATPSDGGNDWVQQGSSAAQFFSSVGYEQGDTVSTAVKKFSGAWLVVALLRYVVPILFQRLTTPTVRGLFIATILASGSAAMAESITGPSEIGEDDPAVFSIDLGESAQVAWDVFPKPAAKIATFGPSACLYAPPGTYQVEAMVVDFDARRMNKVFQTVSIKPREGQPAPPGPYFPPPPPGPVGFDWEKWAYDASRSFPPNERFDIAKIFAEEAANTRHAEVEDLLRATRGRIITLVGRRWDSWTNQFKALFERELADADLPEYRRVWNRVDSGLKK